MTPLSIDRKSKMKHNFTKPYTTYDREIEIHIQREGSIPNNNQYHHARVNYQRNLGTGQRVRKWIHSGVALERSFENTIGIKPA